MNRNLKVYTAASFVVFLSLIVPGCLTEQDQEENRPLLITHHQEIKRENASIGKLSQLDRSRVEQEIPFIIDPLQRAIDDNLSSIRDQDEIKAIDSYLRKYHDDNLPATIEFEQEIYSLQFIAH